jgi:hypothetical protein
MKLSAIFAVTDSSMRKKSFIALGGKMSRPGGFCNRCDRVPLMFFEELNMSQLAGIFRLVRDIFEKEFERTNTRDRAEPAGAVGLMNVIDFDASNTALEREFSYGVKKRYRCGRLPSGAEVNAWGAVAAGEVGGDIAGYLSALFFRRRGRRGVR